MSCLSSLRRLLFSTAFVATAALAAAPAANAAEIVRCESINGQPQSCPANISGEVTLQTQLSNAGCWQNDTWGHDNNQIWVTRGCRADFRIGGGPAASSGDSDGATIAGVLVLGAIAAAAIASSNDRDRDRNRGRSRDRDFFDDDRDFDDFGYRGGREIRCESQNGSYQTCGRVDRGDRVDIRRQLSKAGCSYGRSWGVNNRQLWVDHGCRAVFVAY